MKTLALLAGAALLTGHVLATTISWDLSSPAGNLGTSHVFFSNGVGLPAYGFCTVGVPCNLYGKSDLPAGADEHGLGLAMLSDHEIFAGGFIEFDLSGLTSVMFQMESVQPHFAESWAAFGSNTLGSAQAFFSAGLDEGVDHSFSGYRYLILGGNDVLVGKITGDAPCPIPPGEVPEPGTLGLAGIGTALVIAARIKKFRRKHANEL